MTTTYTVFTRNSTDHSVVHIIASNLSDYADASSVAGRCSGCIMFTDQFMAHFVPTSPNRMNGNLR